MKISDTKQILKFVADSDNLVLKIGMGKNEKAILYIIPLTVLTFIFN